MKMKNRKGSTLALTLIVFAVLMIFATFLLGFMVTENKQAMYYQNKTQAYYIAKSGADVVEAALKEQLYAYSDNETDQRKFVDEYDDPKEIAVDLDNLDGHVLVVNDKINGKRVMTIKSTAKYRGITQTVKKVLYSTKSIITKEENGQFIPMGGELFIYLGNDKPKEIDKNGNHWRYVPDKYLRQASEDEKKRYVKDDFKVIENWAEADNIVESNGKKIISSGTYGTPGAVTNIYVDGSLIMEGLINFKGNVNIYVKDALQINGGSSIIGETEMTEKGKLYKLKIYVYNQNPTTYNISLFNNPAASNISIVGDLYIDSGNVKINVHQEGSIDGNIAYYGETIKDEEFRFSSDSNNFTDKKLLTGSIYAPFGTVSLGIDTSKTANIIGGQIIANTINVYPNNKTQAEKFYSNSTKERINNPIPVDITESIDIKQYGYDSYYVE